MSEVSKDVEDTTVEKLFYKLSTANLPLTLSIRVKEVR